MTYTEEQAETDNHQVHRRIDKLIQVLRRRGVKITEEDLIEVNA